MGTDISGWIELIEDFDMDPSAVDLVLALPDLSGQQAVMWLVSLVLWRLVFSRLERYAAFHGRRALSRGLFRAAALVKPRMI